MNQKTYPTRHQVLAHLGSGTRASDTLPRTTSVSRGQMFIYVIRSRRSFLFVKFIVSIDSVCELRQICTDCTDGALLFAYMLVHIFYTWPILVVFMSKWMVIIVITFQNKFRIRTRFQSPTQYFKRYNRSDPQPEVLVVAIHIIKTIKYSEVENLWRKHYENTPIQIYRKFHLKKLKIFR